MILVLGIWSFFGFWVLGFGDSAVHGERWGEGANHTQDEISRIGPFNPALLRRFFGDKSPKEKAVTSHRTPNDVVSLLYPSRFNTTTPSGGNRSGAENGWPWTLYSSAFTPPRLP